MASSIVPPHASAAINTNNGLNRFAGARREYRIASSSDSGHPRGGSIDEAKACSIRGLKRSAWCRKDAEPI
jgi:hypothetical protein